MCMHVQATGVAESQRATPEGQKETGPPKACWGERVAVSPDGSWFATCGDGRRKHVAVWHTGTFSVVRMLPGTLQATLPVFRPDMHDPELPVNRVYGGVYDPRPAVNCLAWRPDSSLLATGDMKEGTVTVWNVATGAVTMSLRDDGGDPGEDGSPPRAISAVAWSPDGLKLCTTNRRAGGSVWELATGKVEHVLEASERFFWVGVA